MQAEVEELNHKGFNLQIPPNCVSANYDIEFFKYRELPMKNRLINPYRLGYKNELVETHLNLPYEAIGIQEAQRYLNSRRSANFPDWQSRWYEQTGHNGIDVFLDTQRPTLLDVNIRELARFIEVRALNVEYDSRNNVKRAIWDVREFSDSSALDSYLSSGRKESEYYTKNRYVADYDIFTCYDTHNCKARFYDGREKEQFCFTEDVDDELPANFYKREIKKGDTKC